MEWPLLNRTSTRRRVINNSVHVINNDSSQLQSGMNFMYASKCWSERTTLAAAELSVRRIPRMASQCAVITPLWPGCRHSDSRSTLMLSAFVASYFIKCVGWFVLIDRALVKLGRHRCGDKRTCNFSDREYPYPTPLDTERNTAKNDLPLGAIKTACSWKAPWCLVRIWAAFIM